MMPPSVGVGTVSPGERDIFARLKEDDLTADWIVLHSLGIADHERNLAGEADFVVLVPELGVLCIEVKAHSRGYCHNGKWYFGADARGDERGPFRQASECMYSLIRYLDEQAPALSNTLFWTAVAFPYFDFKTQSPEWHPWQVIDRQVFTSRPFSDAVRDVLHTAQRFAASKDKYFRAPTAADCAVIADVFRPSFEFFESPRQRLRMQEGEVKQYTREQFRALDAMATNPRVIFEGPAGTGKTTLALEAAQRGAAAGRHVLLLCFNHLLGQWLRDQALGITNLKASTLHRHMLDVTGDKPVDDPAFWSEVLPERATDTLLESLTCEPPNEKWLYDEIIIDEAQDLLLEAYLNFIAFSVKGGLEGGRWRLFGDFSRQALFNADTNIDAFLEQRATGPRYSLRTNCRNTPRVAAFVQLYGRLNPHYDQVLRSDDGFEPSFHFYRDDQAATLAATLQTLYDDGFRGEDIVVLSPREASKSAAASVVHAPWRDRLKPIHRRAPGCVSYGSIHAFKGLEAPAVIVTDVEDLTSISGVDVFYTAASRAFSRLHIVAHEACQRQITALLGQQLDI